MAKATRNRTQRREARSSAPTAGAYGIDVDDAGADSWTGRYLLFATSSAQARARVRGAGFHKTQIHRRWSPGNLPPDGLPSALGAGDDRWFRARLDDDGWTAWKALPPTYRHPSQVRVAADPTLR